MTITAWAKEHFVKLLSVNRTYLTGYFTFVKSKWCLMHWLAEEHHESRFESYVNHVNMPSVLLVGLLGVHLLPRHFTCSPIIIIINHLSGVGSQR